MFAAALLLAEGQSADPFGMMFPIIIIVVLGYFMLLRPMQRQEKERQELLKKTEKNDRVITNAGIHGTVTWVSDTEDEMEVRIADNVKIKMLKSCVHRNLTKEEALAAQKVAAGAQPSTTDIKK
jgi:preprotein translocase subunit YajC